MSRATKNDPRAAPQGLGPAGWNPLFFGVLVGVILGLAAGILAGDREPAIALYSNIVFRVEVGLIVALVAYWVAAALWLSWHQTLFRRIGIGNTGVEPPEQDPVAQRDSKVEDFMSETTETLANLEERLSALEDARDSKP